MASAHAGRERAVNVALLLASSVLSLLAALALLPVDLALNPTVFALDEHCLYRLVPGSVKVVQHLRVNGGGRVVVQVNAEGFRGDELAERSQVRRVVVFGDSFIEAEGSALEETFCERLEGLLGRSLPGRPTEVVNAGVVGYGPDQACVRLADDLDRLTPDLVVFALYGGNDFGDLLRNKLYGLDDAGVLRERRPVLSAGLRGHLARSAEGVRSDGWARRRLTSLYWKLNPRVVEREAGLPARGRNEGLIAWSLRACDDEYRSCVTQGDATVVNLLADHFDADVALHPDRPAARHKAALLDAVVRRARETLAARGVPMLLLIIPAAVDVCPDRHLKGVAQELEGERRATLTDVLDGVGRRNGIPSLNLFPPFVDESRRAHLYYRDPETHWNAAGQELAARLAADAIVANALLRPDRAVPAPALPESRGQRSRAPWESSRQTRASLATPAPANAATMASPTVGASRAPATANSEGPAPERLQPSARASSAAR